MTKHVLVKFGISLAITAAFCTLSYVLWDRTILGAIHALPASWIHLGKRVSVFGKAEWYWVPGLLFAAVFWFIRRNLKLFYTSLFFCLSLAMGGILSTVLLAEAHYLSDVAAGTYLGVVAALIVGPMMRKWSESSIRDSRIEQVEQG